MELNSVVITGYICNNITIDELRKTKDGISVINIRIGCEKENNHNQSDFITCSAFGQNADNIFKYVKKGDHVGIEGRLCSDEFQDENDVTRYNTFVKIKRIIFK